MKNASYRAAIAWIGENDSVGDATALVESEVAYLTTAVMVADLFNVPSEKVGKDIVAYRVKANRRERQA